MQPMSLIFRFSCVIILSSYFPVDTLCDSHSTMISISCEHFANVQDVVRVCWTRISFQYAAQLSFQCHYEQFPLKQSTLILSNMQQLASHYSGCFEFPHSLTCSSRFRTTFSTFSHLNHSHDDIFRSSSYKISKYCYLINSLPLPLTLPYSTRRNGDETYLAALSYQIFDFFFYHRRR